MGWGTDPLAETKAEYTAGGGGWGEQDLPAPQERPREQATIREPKRHEIVQYHVQKLADATGIPYEVLHGAAASVIPTITTAGGALAGGAIGSAGGPAGATAGAVGGAMLGSGAGETLNQMAGITEPSQNAVTAATALPGVMERGQAAYRVAKPVIARNLPGAGRALQERGATEAQAAMDQYHPTKFQETTPEQFAGARAGARSQEFLTPHSPDDLAKIQKAGGHLVLSNDGKTGYVLDAKGDLQNLFNIGDKGQGSLAVKDAIAQGAQSLDVFDSKLVDYYKQHGFVETGRAKFDPKYAPKGWEQTSLKSQPDVVFMRRAADAEKGSRPTLKSSDLYEELHQHDKQVINGKPVVQQIDKLLKQELITPGVKETDANITWLRQVRRDLYDVNTKKADVNFENLRALQKDINENPDKGTPGMRRSILKSIYEAVNGTPGAEKVAADLSFANATKKREVGMERISKLLLQAAPEKSGDVRLLSDSARTSFKKALDTDEELKGHFTPQVRTEMKRALDAIGPLPAIPAEQAKAVFAGLRYSAGGVLGSVASKLTGIPYEYGVAGGMTAAIALDTVMSSPWGRKKIIEMATHGGKPVDAKALMTVAAALRAGGEGAHEARPEE